MPLTPMQYHPMGLIWEFMVCMENICLNMESHVMGGMGAVMGVVLSHCDTYSGSQKYVPTFEPTLHQDFQLWLC